MKSPLKRAVVLGVAAALATPLSAYATNGMFVIGYGAKARGMGGVAIAFPQDSLSSAVNPAALTQVGTRADASLSIFMPKATACIQTNTSPVCAKSEADLFGMPAMGMAMQFTRNLSFGMTMVGAGGGGSRYATNLYNVASANAGADPHATLGVSLMIAQMNPTVAMRIGHHQSFGASLVIGVQQFRAFGLSYFENFTADGLNTTTLTNNGNDYTYGAGLRVGWLGNFFNDRLTLGAEAQTKVYMTRFKKYGNLFADHGNLDTPANYGIGMSFKITPQLRAGIDITRTLYQGVAAIGNAPPAVPGRGVGGSIYPNSLTDNKLGLPGGLGFGWHNQTVYKIGAAYKYDSQWTFRAGYDYGKSPIPQDNGGILFNIVAPATVQSHATVGATYSPNPNMEFTVSYIHAFMHGQYGPTYIGGQSSIKMMQNSLGMEFSYKM